MNEPRTLLVFGAGGHGKVVADVARSTGWVVVAFVDDSSQLEGHTLWGLPIYTLERLRRERPQLLTTQVGLGVGDNSRRERALLRLREVGFAAPALVHASATVAPTASLGEAVVVMAQAVVNPDARVGDGCIVNTGAVVEHDCVLGDFAHLSPNSALGGSVVIGARSHLGLGAVVLPGRKIGADVVVGAGAVVIADVDSGQTVVGIPARPLRLRGR